MSCLRFIVPSVLSAANDRSGPIACAFVEADYKVELPADELLEVATALAAPSAGGHRA